MNKSGRVIVALDLPTADHAIQMAQRIAPVFPFFKVGIRLFTQAGPPLIRTLVQHGNLFLDLKYHDIPSVVADAVEQASDLGVSLLTIHASGGREMMQLSAERVQKLSKKPRLLAVTVLTSLNDLNEFGTSRSVSEQVELLAGLAKKSGMDGIICSPAELNYLRPKFAAPFLMVTPGIRGAKDEKGDQKRTSSPSAAFAAGADYLVIGRPIVGALDPLAAAQAIAQEIGA
jgi:orotidine-5'-phosphate decarboxylase